RLLGSFLWRFGLADWLEEVQRKLVLIAVGSGGVERKFDLAMRRLAGLEGHAAFDGVGRLILLGILGGTKGIEVHRLIFAGQAEGVDLGADDEAFIGRRLLGRLNINDLDADRRAVLADDNREERYAFAAGAGAQFADGGLGTDGAAAVADEHDPLHHI